jgi:predicted amidohydrolase
MNAEEVAEPYEGATERFLSELAGEHSIWLIGGAAMRGRDGKPRNKALIFSPEGKLEAFYSKMRLFSPGGEGEHYQAGDHAVMFRWGECTVAPFICYDLRFPEIFREGTRNARPELFCVIANWPAKRIQHWIRLLQARAIENQAYVAGISRVGSDPHYEYAGRSLIIDPQGEILADAGDGEGNIAATLDLVNLRKYRDGLPFLTDMK